MMMSTLQEHNNVMSLPVYTIYYNLKLQIVYPYTTEILTLSYYGLYIKTP